MIVLIVWAHKTSLNPPLFIEMSSQWSINHLNTHGMSHADTNTDPGLGQTQTYADAKLGNNNPTLPLYK
jgi:hypothetical protein